MSAQDPAAGGAMVLVVEDNASLRELVRQVLGAAGYAVVAAGTAAEALELWSEHAGDVALVVTDLVLPGESGLELCAALQAMRPGLPSIVMSGHGRDEIGAAELDAVGARLLEKPFDVHELVRVAGIALAGA